MISFMGTVFSEITVMNYIEVEKLKWRSRRSMLELDLYFDRFIQSGQFALLDEGELLLYKELLRLDDGDLLLLFQGKQKLENFLMQSLVDKIVNTSFK
jgi:succinate dehydrogenase flavin-adding protein (antitoxin of CptAB toxin-antitoxin module)